MLVVIDPGHGGEDPGAVGSGLREKDITLKLSQFTAAELSARGARVITTRDEDAAVSLSALAGLANTKGADFFLSLHVNAGGGTGFESYVHTEAPRRTEELRDLLHREVARFYAERGFVDRGMKRANFAVLRQTRMPTVLLENLFIDSEKDAAALKDEGFLKELAKAITGALARALGLQDLAISPGAPEGWGPDAEIARLRERGLVINHHRADEPVTWGEFATVINRILRY